MSALYGTLTGAAKTTATRRGHRKLTTHAACWQGAIRTDLFCNENGITTFEVRIVPWRDSGGCERLIACGTLDSSKG